MLTRLQLTNSEIWKPVVGYEGLYKVSNLGRVKSLPRWIFAGLPNAWKKPAEILKGTIHTNGYVRVGLCKAGKVRLRYVHKLVLEAFVGSCPKGMETCHFPDQDRTNNHLNNLRWGTRKSNRQDQKIHGTYPSGINNPAAILTPKLVRKIRYFHEVKNKSIAWLACKCKVSRGCIQGVVEYTTWKDV